MKVFATKFLEPMSNNTVSVEEWTWTPNGENAQQVYACGASTSSRQSTYAAEKDNRSDSDRPNEGMYVA